MRSLESFVEVWCRMTLAETLIVAFLLWFVLVSLWPRGDTLQERWESFVKGLQGVGTILAGLAFFVAGSFFFVAMFDGTLDRWLRAVFRRWRALLTSLWSG